MTHQIFPVILCGGGGTRLWPRSRVALPKPFLPLVGKHTLFQDTLERVSDDTIFAAPTIVAGEKHLPLVVKQLAGTSALTVIAEPEGKNTAPAIALAAHSLPADAVMLICPSDHFIDDTHSFVAAAQSAARLAADGHLVSFGINPTKPETGYGYIKRGAALEEGFVVDRFVEKPDQQTAEIFLKDGGFSWNGGIFAFRVDRFLEELQTHRPEMAELVAEAFANRSQRAGVTYPDASKFSQIAADSVDYAVMENTGAAAVLPTSMGWSDIGNWKALRDARQAHSVGPTELLDCTNVMVDTDGPRVSVIGLNDVIIVVNGDEVLITSADGAQDVGKLHGAKNQ